MAGEIMNFPDEEIEDFYRCVAFNVQKIRKANGMSQLDLALCIDIKSVAFFSNCENNRYGKHFNLEHLYKIAKIFDVPIGCFFEEI